MKEDLDELWEYTAWELFRTSIKVFFWDVWQLLKPSRLYRKLRPLSEEEIKQLRTQQSQHIKEELAKKLGGNPDDYVVRDISTKEFEENFLENIKNT